MCTNLGRGDLQSAVVIPTKNREALIGRAIESALRQTLPVAEVIVVDDGSEDGTHAVVRALAEADPRVRLIPLHVSGGAASARNRGVSETHAEWICFLDSDDAWAPEKHAAQARAIANAPGVVASFTGLRYVAQTYSFEVPAPASVTHLDLRGANVVGSTSSAMVRRDALLAVGGFDPDLPSCQDWDLWIKLRQRGEFALVRDALVDFTQDSNVRISKNKTAVFAGHDVVFSRALQGVDDHRQRRRIRSEHARRLAQIMLYDTGDPLGAAGKALKSLGERPTRDGVGLLLRSLRASMFGAPA